MESDGKQVEEKMRVQGARFHVHRKSICTLNFGGDGEERWYGNNCNNSTTYTKIRCFNGIAGKPFDAAEIEKAK